MFPWTPLGLAVAVVSGLALRFLAYAQLDMVWLVLGWAGIGLVAMPLLWVVPAAIYLARRDEGEAGREALSLETGQSVETGYRVPAPRFFPLMVLRLRFLQPPGVQAWMARRDGQLRERARVDDRGRFSALVRRVDVQDAFGLCRIGVRRRSPRSLTAYPALGMLSRLPSLTSFAAGDELPHPLGLADGDRIELSRYVPGDPARFIHWKVFARTRTLMVRRPERALSMARRVAAFYVPAAHDDASAGLCRLALTRGLLGEDWRFATTGHGRGTADVNEAVSWLLSSARERDRGAEGLAGFFADVERGGPAALMLFVPNRPGPWLAQVAAAVRGRRVRVLLAVDGLAPDVRRGRLARFMVKPTVSEAPTRVELDEVVVSLRRAGCTVSVFDRQRGALVSDGQRAPAPAAMAGARPGVAA